jgi:hypothetical protein
VSPALNDRAEHLVGRAAAKVALTEVLRGSMRKPLHGRPAVRSRYGKLTGSARDRTQSGVRGCDRHEPPRASGGTGSRFPDGLAMFELSRTRRISAG